MEDVDNHVARLRAQRRHSGQEQGRPSALAQAEFDRAAKLLANGAVTQQNCMTRGKRPCRPHRRNLTQTLAKVHQIRASLGLPEQPENGDLVETPPDLDQTFSSVREAQAALIQTAAQLGVSHSYKQLPKEMVEQFERLDQGDVDRALAGLTADAPDVKQAQAKLEIRQT